MRFICLNSCSRSYGLFEMQATNTVQSRVIKQTLFGIIDWYSLWYSNYDGYSMRRDELLHKIIAELNSMSGKKIAEGMSLKMFTSDRSFVRRWFGLSADQNERAPWSDHAQILHAIVISVQMEKIDLPKSVNVTLNVNQSEEVNSRPVNTLRVWPWGTQGKRYSYQSVT